MAVSIFHADIHPGAVFQGNWPAFAGMDFVDAEIGRRAPALVSGAQKGACQSDWLCTAETGPAAKPKLIRREKNQTYEHTDSLESLA
jgi:hypothetical protein